VDVVEPTDMLGSGGLAARDARPRPPGTPCAAGCRRSERARKI